MGGGGRKSRRPRCKPRPVVHSATGLWRSNRAVPSLFRFLFIVGVLGAIVYGGMWALVTYVEPQQREMSQTLPANRLGGGK